MVGHEATLVAFAHPDRRVRRVAQTSCRAGDATEDPAERIRCAGSRRVPVERARPRRRLLHVPRSSRRPGGLGITDGRAFARGRRACRTGDSAWTPFRESDERFSLHLVRSARSRGESSTGPLASAGAPSRLLARQVERLTRGAGRPSPPLPARSRAIHARPRPIGTGPAPWPCAAAGRPARSASGASSSARGLVGRRGFQRFAHRRRTSSILWHRPGI